MLFIYRYLKPDRNQGRGQFFIVAAKHCHQGRMDEKEEQKVIKENTFDRRTYLEAHANRKLARLQQNESNQLQVTYD